MASTHYSYTEVIASPGMTTVDITFPFIDKDYIKADVYINNALVDSGRYTLTKDKVTFKTPLVGGENVRIQRRTPLTGIMNIFANHAEFSNDSVDQNFLQLVYLFQEATEFALSSSFESDVDMKTHIIYNLGLPKDSNGNLIPSAAVNLEYLTSVIDPLQVKHDIIIDNINAIQNVSNIKDAVVHVSDISDTINQVNGMRQDIIDLAEVAEQIEIVGKDFESYADYSSNHDMGIWNIDDTNYEYPVGGSIYKVAQNMDDIRTIASTVPTILEYIVNIDSKLNQAMDYANDARQSANSALAAEARIQELEQEIRELISTNYAAVAAGQ